MSAVSSILDEAKDLKLLPILGTSVVTQFPVASVAEMALAAIAGKKIINGLFAKPEAPVADRPYDYAPDGPAAPAPRMA